MNIGFKVTAEFDCPNMIDEETFNREYGGDPMLAYKAISDNFSDNPLNFSDDDRIVRVDLLGIEPKDLQTTYIVNGVDVTSFAKVSVDGNDTVVDIVYPNK